MKIKRLIIIITFTLIGIFIFRNALLHMVTRDWEKEFLEFETSDFKVEIAINLEKGCVKSGIEFQNDTIFISNLRLTDILQFLTNTNINNSHFVGLRKNRKEKYNFSYYPKDSTSKYEIHIGEILDTLSHEFKFNYKYNTVSKTAYSPYIYDYKRLEKHKTSNHSGRFQMKKSYIKCYGGNLVQIFSSFNSHIEDFIINSQITDSSYYEFNIPTTDKDKLISYLNNDFGIKFIQKKTPIEILTIHFE